ncbi:hypothetical protein GCM10027517_11740 [Phycicoccus ginsengisoli]
MAISALVAATAGIVLNRGVAGHHLQSWPAATTVAALIGLGCLALSATRTDLTLTSHPTKTAPISTSGPTHLDGLRLTQQFVDTHSLRASSLRAADLSGLDLTKTDLDGADARGANFSRANLAQAHAVGADFRGADLTRTCLDRTNLRGADLHGVTATGADTTDTATDPGATQTAATWPRKPDPAACNP